FLESLCPEELWVDALRPAWSPDDGGLLGAAGEDGPLDPGVAERIAGPPRGEPAHQRVERASAVADLCPILAALKCSIGAAFERQLPIEPKRSGLGCRTGRSEVVRDRIATANRVACPGDQDSIDGE